MLHGDFCSIYMPTALESSHGNQILAATLSISVTRRASLGLNESQAELEQLKYVALMHLRSHLSGQTKVPDHISAATALILCLSEIMAGGIEPDSRILHLQGAAAILRGKFQCSHTEKAQAQAETRAMLWRFWRSLEKLVVRLAPRSIEKE